MPPRAEMSHPPVMKKARAGERLYASFGNSLNKHYGEYTLAELELLAQYYVRMRNVLAEEIRTLSTSQRRRN